MSSLWRARPLVVRHLMEVAGGILLLAGVALVFIRVFQSGSRRYESMVEGIGGLGVMVWFVGVILLVAASL